jgi:PAS domain S-box-containing protein
VALTGAESLRQGLQQCAEILARNIDAAFARIWTVNQADKVLELQASAGMYTHLDGGHARVPMGQFKIGRIAENGEPHLTNTVQQDSGVRDPEWARREGMVAFAGYPLKVEERVLGVVAAFARKPLTPATLQAFASVAYNIAQFIKRKRGEEALRESEEKYRALIETTGTGYVIIDTEGRVIDANPEYVRLTGRRALHEVLGHRIAEWTAQHDLARTAEAIRRCAELGLTRNFEIEHVNGDGKCTPIEVNATVVPAAGGVRMVGLCRDITERKRAEKALRESEERFRAIVENAPFGYYRVGKDGLWQYVNPVWERMHGLSSEEVIGKRFEITQPPDSVGEARELVKRALAGETIVGEFGRLTREGNTEYHSFNIQPVKHRAEIVGIEGFINDITERKRAEEALRESEERFRLLAETMPDAVLVGQDGMNVYANAAAARLLRAAGPEELVGVDVFALIAPTHHEWAQRQMQRALAGEKQPPFEDRFVRLDGSSVPVEIAVSLLTWQGRPALQVVVRDVTERKRAEEALKKSTQLLRDTGEMAKVGGWELDLSTKEVSWTEEVGRIHGVGPGYRPKLEEALNFYAPESRPALEEALKKAAETGEPYDLESLFIPSGSKDKIWVRSLGRAVYSGGRIVKLAGTFQNIDKYKRAEEALRQSEENFEALAESASEGILIATGEEGRHVYANRRAVEITGYPIEELLKTCMRDLAHPDELPKLAERYKERLERLEVPKPYETTFLNKDGVKVPIEISPSRTIWQNQLADMVMFRDITERKRAEEAVRWASAYNRSLIEASLDPLVTIAPDGKITDVNNTTEKVTGLSRQQLIGTDFSDYFTDSGKARAGYEQVFREGLVQNYELEIRHRDGHVTPVLYNAAVYRDEAGNVIGVFAAARDISERKRAEEALRESEERFRSLVENATVGIYRTTPDGHILMANPALVRMLGFDSFEELAARNLECEGFESSYPRSVFRERIEREGQVIGLEAAWIRHDGSVIFVRESAKAVRADAGRVLYYDGIIEDITTRRHAEEAVRRAGAYNRSLIEASLDPLVTIAPDGKITDANNTTEKVTGRSRQQLIGTDFSDYFTDSGKARAGYEQVFREGLVQDYELEIRHRDGHVTPVLYNASVYRDEAGDVIGVFAAARDITERKQAEGALRQSEQRFRRLSEATFEAIVIHDKGKILDANETFAKMFGYELSQVIGKNVLDFTAPESRHLVLKNILSLHGKPYEVVALRKDGSAFVEICAKSIPYGGRTVKVAAIRDITAHKRVEQELHESEERYRSLVEAAPDVIYTVSAEDGSLTSLNPAFETLTGWSRAEWLGKPFVGMVHPDDLPVAVERFQKALRGETHPPHELRVLCKSGEYLVGEFTSAAHVKDGKVVAQLGIARDITERKRAEESMRQLSGRLLRLQDEERRRIARQLHETTAQGLAGLAINLNMVKDSATHLSPRASACLSESLELAEQCSREIRTLSYLLHPPLVDEAGLAPALRWYTAGFGQRSGIEVHVEVSPEFGRLPSEFELTLYRIVQEALTNIHRHSGSKTARICLERRPNEIVLTVADEGHGFPSAALGTAGPESADVGVGIPGMQERARQLGGRLHIQSGSGGTTLTAILPLRQVTNAQTTLPFGG